MKTKTTKQIEKKLERNNRGVHLSWLDERVKHKTYLRWQLLTFS